MIIDYNITYGEYSMGEKTEKVNCTFKAYFFWNIYYSPVSNSATQSPHSKQDF